jgi:dolichyl-diphosphooligosaccharide--protein glycosyltransferase
MYTSAIFYWILHKLRISVGLINICVFMGPTFSILSTILAFLFGKLIDGPSLGIVCAFLTSFAAGMIPRSVSGSFDYECISLALIMLCFYFLLWL